MQKYLTIKEATSLSGRSEYEVRQWTQAQYARQEAQSAQHATQQEAQQVVEELVRKENQTANPNSPMRYVIREDVVLSVFGKKEESDNTAQPQAQEATHQAQQEAPQQAQQAQPQAQQPIDETTRELINVLKDQVRDQAEQIREYQKTVGQLSATVFDHGKTIKDLSMRIEAPRREAREYTQEEEIK